MARINSIRLNNFRNFKNLDLLFGDKSNIFFGNNGSGKTNILEAISLISKGRGIRNSKINSLIKSKENKFYIKSCLEIKNIIYDIDISIDNKDEKLSKITKINGDQSKESLVFLNSSCISAKSTT